MNYRNVNVKVDESVHFVEDGYTVNGGTVMVYKASSVYGVSYALTPASALEGVHRQIDRALGDNEPRYK